MANVYRNTLLGCCSDIGVCLYGYFCIECLNGDNLARVRQEECTPYHVICPVSPFWIRQMLKKERGMEADYLSDCCVMTFCLPCGICQDARELRGL